MRTKKAEQPSAVKAAQPSTSHQPARAATPQAPPRDSQPSRLGDPRRVDTPVAAQAAPNPALFLAESLAHVIVGEWLFKDPHKPGLFPQSNILQRHIGPPPRGATGVPQRRWFRIDPYERLLSWSSKWDTVETAQHKMSRKVPIKLVFEVPNRIPLDGCIPTHAAPYDYSIVVVAPSKVLKITAPDDTRHNMWLTALQYLVDATKKVNNDTWPDVLATRLALLTQPVEDLFATDKPLPTPRSRQEDHPDARASVATDKPLPPSPPRIATASTAMKPPSVPRFVQHGREQSAGLSTTAETEAFGRTSESSKGVAASVRSQQAEPFTPYDEKPVSEPRESMQQETGHDTDTETDVGQMDAILDRLPGM
ncbi:uncharacterized protein HMPREF1541_03194 [Cyphellophora europaea CBS 101466]|uniref:Pleckstrin homology domain-containing protein n=1 Tax=Cyphellophora europaea (strain CBS 101466) TaxID=1220924 RepID=W2RZY2_CYPE1|nr:uncharacterized protein HMPREF1541_03194 [Cyphellophora europaea CBS 101466]ETN41259.1 hypothetical protein HMPREF1541_03194 [Cyphellophora europaea CBS 101466]